MKAKNPARLAAGLLLCGGLASARADEQSDAAAVSNLAARVAAANSAVPAWMKDHLELGTRFTYVWLRDHRRDPLSGIDGAPGSYYGSINELDPVQSYWPLKLFADYKFCPYGGVELALDYFSVRTITQLDGHTDGDLNLVGPQLSVFGRYPNATAFTPYAGAGLAYYHASFDENPDWHAPPGRPEIQTMDFTHTYGAFLYGGLLWDFAGHWSADLLVRYTWLRDADGTHWGGPDGTDFNGSPSFPLSNIAAGVGIRYRF